MTDKFGELTLESMNQADWYNQWTLNKFKKYIGDQILEVGCGIGNFTKELTKYGKVLAIDINKNYLDKLKKIPGVEVGFGDIEKGGYFFTNKQFNTIICLNVLEHLEEDSQAIKNMYEVLNKGGNLILLVPSHPFLYGEIDKSIGHFRRYSKKEIVDKLQACGFVILEFRSINFLGSLGWLISGRLLKNKIVDQSKIKLFNILAPIFLRIEDLITPPFGTSFLIIAKKKINETIDHNPSF